jgi:DNA-binding MarR family transcriptional regulator
MSELSTALRASPAGASGLLARMESAGLVARLADESDQRITRVTLTDHGAQLAREARAALDDLNVALNEGFNEQELVTVARWLSHAADTLSTPRSADSAHAQGTRSADW